MVELKVKMCVKNRLNKGKAYILKNCKSTGIKREWL